MNDPLNKEENNIQNKDKFYFVMSYIPFLQFIFVFSDIKKSSELKKHMNQWITLFVAYFISMLILWIFMPYAITKIVWYAYFGLAIYLAWNAYNGKFIYIPMVDEISEVLKSFIWWEKKTEDNMNKDKKNDIEF